MDASVALAWFLPDEKSTVLEYARSVLDALERDTHQAVVPSAWHMEVAAVLLTEVGAIVEIARRYHLQAGDAIYFDLAYGLGLPIATVDGGLRAAAKAHGVKLFAA